MENKPLISIVTVSYNAVSTIEQTILSVINQTYSDIEYIVIDGGSKDGTVDLIKKYADKITYWISESDNGIYDAMNKGIKIASGEWINFMNCGDFFYDNDVISKIFNCDVKRNSDVIYGKRILSFADRKFIQDPKRLDEFENDFPIFHQSVFVLTKLMKINNFNCNYKICADYNFFYILWKNKCKFEFADLIISICDCEFGISSLYKNEPIRVKENILIQKAHISFFSKLRLFIVSLFYGKTNVNLNLRT